MIVYCIIDHLLYNFTQRSTWTRQNQRHTFDNAADLFVIYAQLATSYSTTILLIPISQCVFQSSDMYKLSSNLHEVSKPSPTHSLTCKSLVKACKHCKSLNNATLQHLTHTQDIAYANLYHMVNPDNKPSSFNLLSGWNSTKQRFNSVNPIAYFAIHSMRKPHVIVHKHITPRFQRTTLLWWLH